MNRRPRRRPSVSPGNGFRTPGGAYIARPAMYAINAGDPGAGAAGRAELLCNFAALSRGVFVTVLRVGVGLGFERVVALLEGVGNVLYPDFRDQLFPPNL